MKIDLEIKENLRKFLQPPNWSTLTSSMESMDKASFLLSTMVLNRADFCSVTAACLPKASEMTRIDKINHFMFNLCWFVY